jgi:hypothetical protein
MIAWGQVASRVAWGQVGSWIGRRFSVEVDASPEAGALAAETRVPLRAPMSRARRSSSSWRSFTAMPARLVSGPGASQSQRGGDPRLAHRAYGGDGAEISRQPGLKLNYSMAAEVLLLLETLEKCQERHLVVV